MDNRDDLEERQGEYNQRKNAKAQGDQLLPFVLRLVGGICLVFIIVFFLFALMMGRMTT